MIGRTSRTMAFGCRGSGFRVSLLLGVGVQGLLLLGVGI